MLLIRLDRLEDGGADGNPERMSETLQIRGVQNKQS